MRLHDLNPRKDANKNRRRVGRGVGSGRGKTSGRGHKGQKSRSGSKLHPLFEGGQTPLFRRLPKRGFTSKFKKQYAIVNVNELNCFTENEEVDPERLIESGLINKIQDGVKILGDGELEKALVVRAHRFSNSAAEKIRAAGGKVEVI